MGTYELRLRKQIKTLKVLAVIFGIITVVASIDLAGLVLDKLLKGAPGGELQINPHKLEALKNFLGLDLLPIDEEIVEELKLEKTQGLLVNAVIANSPAERASFQEGDIIVAVDGKEIYDVDQMLNLVARRVPGECVDILVSRDGRLKSLCMWCTEIKAEPINSITL